MRSFSTPTLAKFEDAAASIPLRDLVRAFEAADVALGDDPGGAGGERRTRFRRYVAGVDQREEPQLERLGRALGALIAEVAASKVDFLVGVAAADGFAFTDGAFTLASAAAERFDVVRREDVALIGRRTERLRALVLADPDAAIDAARSLLEALCLGVASAADVPERGGAGLAGVVARTLVAVGLAASAGGDAAPGDVVGDCLGRLVAVLGALDASQGGDTERGRVGERAGRTSRARARLAVGTVITLIDCIADAYVERTRSVRGPTRPLPAIATAPERPRRPAGPRGASRRTP